MAAVRSDAWSRFDNEERGRKVYFYGCDDVTKWSSCRNPCGVIYNLLSLNLCFYRLSDKLFYYTFTTPLLHKLYRQLFSSNRGEINFYYSKTNSMYVYFQKKYLESTWFEFIKEHRCIGVLLLDNEPYFLTMHQYPRFGPRTICLLPTKSTMPSFFICDSQLLNVERLTSYPKACSIS